MIHRPTPPEPVPGHVAGPYTKQQVEKAHAMKFWEEQMVEVSSQNIMLVRNALFKAHAAMMRNMQRFSEEPSIRNLKEATNNVIQDLADMMPTVSYIICHTDRSPWVNPEHARAIDDVSSLMSAIATKIGSINHECLYLNAHDDLEELPHLYREWHQWMMDYIQTLDRLYVDISSCMKMKTIIGFYLKIR